MNFRATVIHTEDDNYIEKAYGRNDSTKWRTSEVKGSDQTSQKVTSLIVIVIVIKHLYSAT